MQHVMLVVVVMMLVVMLVVRVLHVWFLQLLVLVGGRAMLHLLVDIEMLLVGRLVVLLVLMLVM
jgi:hypothetical protein